MDFNNRSKTKKSLTAIVVRLPAQTVFSKLITSYDDLLWVLGHSVIPWGKR
jgi:hypothetical protein